MRIGIDAGPLAGDRGGVGWHTYHLLRSLLDLKGEVDFVAYTRPGQDWPPSGDACWSSARLRRTEAGKWAMLWRGIRDRLDLYHGTNFKMHTTGKYGGVVTIHDVWLDRHPEYSPKMFGQRGSFRRTRRTAWRARKIITVSEFSAREIRDLYGVPPERIAVIYNGVSEDFRPVHDADAMQQLRERLGLPGGGFLLFIGGANPRKNHRVFLEAAAQRLDRLGGRTLVLVGDAMHRFGDYRETARSLGIEKQVLCTGRLSMPDVRLLYSHADLFVFPSLYEGFGMPVLEAMACGAPTITSRTTALPEVGGDAAILVDPENAEELGEAIVRVLEDDGLRRTLTAKGFSRVKDFSWDRAARATFDVYRELVG